MDVIIFCGQSNMQGQSEALTNTEIIPNCFEYRYLKDEIIPLKNPVGEDITFDKLQGDRFENNVDLQQWLKLHVSGSACYGHTNLVPIFCGTYAQTTGNHVLAVHIAKGSTTVAEWLPGTPGYQMIVEKGTSAVEKVKSKENVRHIFFVWLQGESDAVAGNGNAYYKGKITELDKALKKDIAIEKFGIIRVGRFTNDPRDYEIISAQDEICRENNDFLMLTDIATELNKQEKYMNPFVGGHYSAIGLEKLGYEAGKSLGLYCKELQGASK